MDIEALYAKICNLEKNTIHRVELTMEVFQEIVESNGAEVSLSGAMVNQLQAAFDAAAPIYVSMSVDDEGVKMATLCDLLLLNEAFMLYGYDVTFIDMRFFITHRPGYDGWSAALVTTA